MNQLVDAIGVAHSMPFQIALQCKADSSILLLQEKPNILFIDVGCLPNAVQKLKVLIL